MAHHRCSHYQIIKRTRPSIYYLFDFRARSALFFFLHLAIYTKQYDLNRTGNTLQRQSLEIYPSTSLRTQPHCKLNIYCKNNEVVRFTAEAQHDNSLQNRPAASNVPAVDFLPGNCPQRKLGFVLYLNISQHRQFMILQFTSKMLRQQKLIVVTFDLSIKLNDCRLALLRASRHS